MQERRKFPRAKEMFEVKYRATGWRDSPWREVQTVNLSAGGLRFLTPDIIDHDSKLEVELRLRLSDRDTRLHIKGRAVWVTRSSAGLTEVGMRFDDVTLDQQAQIDEVVTFLLNRPRPRRHL